MDSQHLHIDSGDFVSAAHVPLVRKWGLDTSVWVRIGMLMGMVLTGNPGWVETGHCG